MSAQDKQQPTTTTEVSNPDVSISQSEYDCAVDLTRRTRAILRRLQETSLVEDDILLLKDAIDHANTTLYFLTGQTF